MNTISSVGKAKAVIRELDKAIVGKDNVLSLMNKVLK